MGIEAGDFIYEPERWEHRLDAGARRQLDDVRQAFFGGHFSNGYVIVQELEITNLEIINKGIQEKEDIKATIATRKIVKLQESDAQKGINRKYIWENLVAMPPSDWESRPNITFDDIRVTDNGITIFAREAVIRRPFA